MPLTGHAAMLLSFDIAPEAIPEHDRWHTQEHLPERLSIPGFLRGSRWRAEHGEPGYIVLYEVAELAVLDSPAYLARLNDPTPWTRRMMPHYRGMRRGLCKVVGSVGHGLGGVTTLIRYTASPATSDTLDPWVCGQLLPDLAARPGLGSAHLLRAAATAAMTDEQRIRGADLGFDCAIIVSGYDAAAVTACARDPDGLGRLVELGASDPVIATYRLDSLLTAAELVQASGRTQP